MLESYEVVNDEAEAMNTCDAIFRSLQAADGIIMTGEEEQV